VECWGGGHGGFGVVEEFYVNLAQSFINKSALISKMLCKLSFCSCSCTVVVKGLRDIGFSYKR
jgi:hypothetical protein